jgi:3-phenylpropionate/trans-cinnamate dioxygenase ferredoxin reductase component
MRETFVIVGAGLTGGSAVVALREEGFGGDLVLIGAEPEVPYERPPLSKKYLRGEATFEDMLVRPPNFYSDKGIETRFGIRATKGDLEGKVVELEGGNRVPYDKVLIAAGGRNRRPPIAGLDLEGVYDLRTVIDADRIRSQVVPGRKVVIAGMGFIGSEVAASLRTLGMEVSVIARSRLPLDRVLGEKIARVTLRRDWKSRGFFRLSSVRDGWRNVAWPRLGIHRSGGGKAQKRVHPFMHLVLGGCAMPVGPLMPCAKG